MKFSALNVDFSSPSPDSLSSIRPAHADIKKGYPPKSGHFTAIGIIADRYIYAAYHNKHWQRAFKIH